MLVEYEWTLMGQARAGGKGCSGFLMHRSNSMSACARLEIPR